MGAKEFARELAAYCRAYNLDGVAFDDEYSSSPDLSNPWLASQSAYAGSRLMYECKLAMPERLFRSTILEQCTQIAFRLLMVLIRSIL
jgi:hypothetical protein